jgi:hypothetical protein
VQSRWDALIAGDFAQAYRYETSEYREGTPLADYSVRMARGAVRWKLASLKELRYHSPTEAEALIELVFTFALPGSDQVAQTTGRISDWWVYRDEVWWHREDSDSVPSPSGSESLRHLGGDHRIGQHKELEGGSPP